MVQPGLIWQPLDHQSIPLTNTPQVTGKQEAGRGGGGVGVWIKERRVGDAWQDKEYEIKGLENLCQHHNNILEPIYHIQLFTQISPISTGVVSVNVNL